MAEFFVGLGVFICFILVLGMLMLAGMAFVVLGLIGMVFFLCLMIGSAIVHGSDPPQWQFIGMMISIGAIFLGGVFSDDL